MTGKGNSVEEQATIRDRVRETYAAAARNVAGTQPHPLVRELYDGEDLPGGGAVAASLGCANPNVLVDLRPGQTVLDLGSGGGLDVLISARRVAPGGHAIGVDMTPEMLDLALRNAAEAGVSNVEFRRGAIEDLPVGDGEVDVVISNCVVNLSPNKDRVLAEAFRVLVPGGRLAIADLTTLAPLPAPLAKSFAVWTGCLAGALTLEEYERALARAGFVDALLRVHRRFGPDDLALLDGTPLERLAGAGIDETMLRQADGCVGGVFVTATKPARA